MLFFIIRWEDNTTHYFRFFFSQTQVIYSSNLTKKCLYSKNSFVLRWESDDSEFPPTVPSQSQEFGFCVFFWPYFPPSRISALLLFFLPSTKTVGLTVTVIFNFCFFSRPPRNFFLFHPFFPYVVLTSRHWHHNWRRWLWGLYVHYHTPEGSFYFCVFF